MLSGGAGARVSRTGVGATAGAPPIVGADAPKRAGEGWTCLLAGGLGRGVCATEDCTHAERGSGFVAVGGRVWGLPGLGLARKGLQQQGRFSWLISGSWDSRGGMG